MVGLSSNELAATGVIDETRRGDFRTGRRRHTHSERNADVAEDFALGSLA